MDIVHVKMGICEYYFEFETLEDIKKHFKSNGMKFICLDSCDIYDNYSSGKRIAVDELTLKDVKSVQANDTGGHTAFLRGRKQF